MKTIRNFILIVIALALAAGTIIMFLEQTKAMFIILTVCFAVFILGVVALGILSFKYKNFWGKNQNGEDDDYYGEQ